MVKTEEEIYNMIRELRRDQIELRRHADNPDPEIRKDERRLDETYDLMMETLFWALGSNVDLRTWAKESI